MGKGLGSYNGGSHRGATTVRVYAFAQKGMTLFNFQQKNQ
jgi:hypothetical protein